MARQSDARTLGRSPYHLLKRAAQYAAVLYAGTAGQTGLTQRQFTVLAAVEQNDGASQTELVRITGIDRSTMADVVARLAEQGYLQTRRARDDARTNSVRLTAAGRKALRAAGPGAGEVDKQLLAAVPPKYRKTFVEALTSLAQKLEASESKPAAGAKKTGAARSSRVARG
jgi:DNA-binding MarR family transcriptional regulator